MAEAEELNESFIRMCLSPTPPSASIEQVDNGAKCTTRLARLFNNSKFSDIVLRVGDDTYHAHKLLLANTSDVFERMLTSVHWQDAEQTQLTLDEQSDCLAVFADFLKYMYTGQVTLSTDSVLGLLVLADKYNVPDLKDCCSNYMARHLVSSPAENRAVLWYQYSLACSSADLQRACFNYILLNLDVVLQSPDWVYLDRENLVLLLRRCDVIVTCEYTLLQGVVRWLTDESRRDALEENLSLVLPHIRFAMILPECLAEFEASAFEQQYHKYFAPYLLTAYRYHALSVRAAHDSKGDRGAVRKTPSVDESSDVLPTQFMYRNYLNNSYSIHVDVVRKGFRSCPRVSSKVEKPLSLPQNLCNVITERQCKLKVTFYPQGYYTTSLWNGQLNLAKASDATRLVVAHRGGAELQEAEVSVVVYAQHGGLRYADTCLTRRHVFETYGSLDIDNVINIEKLRDDDSIYLIDAALVLKVFVRPITFQRQHIT